MWRPWVLLVALAAAAPDAGWQSVGERDGISVWKRTGRGALVEFRAHTVMPVPLVQVAAVVWDLPRHQEWSANCKESVLLERRPDHSAIAYIHAASPFPLQDRDVVMEQSVRVAGETLEILFHNVQDARKPAVADRVRMSLLCGNYAMRHAGSGRTDVTYSVVTDPGGNLPAWAVNMGGQELPVETLRHLLHQAQSQNYNAAAQQLRTRLPTMAWDPPASSADAP